MSEFLVQCDCCDYFTIPDDDYEICPVCFWKQDSFGILEPDEASCPNHGISLHEGRNNFLLFGACLEKFKANVVTVSEREEYQYVARFI